MGSQGTAVTEKEKLGVQNEQLNVENKMVEVHKQDLKQQEYPLIQILQVEGHELEKTKNRKDVQH